MPIAAQNNAQPRVPNTRRCQRAHCLYCNKLDRTGTIHSSTTNRSYMTRTNISCRCTNLIYAIRCLACDKIYIGQTKRRIMHRLMEHFRNIRQGCNTHIVGRHYNLPGHTGLNNVSVSILECISAHPESARASAIRDRAEKKWIYRLRSLVPIGLNVFD